MGGNFIYEGQSFVIIFITFNLCRFLYINKRCNVIRILATNIYFQNSRPYFELNGMYVKRPYQNCAVKVLSYTLTKYYVLYTFLCKLYTS